MAAKTKTAAKTGGRKTVSENTIRLIVHEMIAELHLDATHARMSEMANSAAKQAVHETLMTIGVDTGDPISAQKTFSALRDLVDTFSDREFKMDIAQLRVWRVNAEAIRNKSILTIVGIATTTLVTALLIGFKGMK